MLSVFAGATVVWDFCPVDVAAAPPFAVADQPNPAVPAGSETPQRLESVKLPAGAAAVQGLTLTKTHYFGTNNSGGAGLIHRYDTDWKLIETKRLKVDGVDHIGAISHFKGFLWAGWLSTGKVRRAIVTQIRIEDLTIKRQFDISADVNWIDPVCYDGKHVWVGDLSDLGIHRYTIDKDQLTRDAVFKYPAGMHFSQGLVIRGRNLYSIHTFGELDGLFEFSIASLKADRVNEPRRSWPIDESTMHLEGFDFIPGTKDEIWHAQGQQVDRWRLTGIGKPAR